MDYNQTIDYLYTHLPMYQRIGAAAYRKDLTNIKALCKVLKQPQNQLRTIHIAGTNGKGSVSHGLASILQQAGYKTGLYTSPHLIDFRERIRIDGQMIDRKTVVEFVELIKNDIKQIDASFFEITTAMAFYYFEQQKVDIAVIETGLGGRLDSTNIITPLLAVITNISYDHQNLLGNTLAEIATEKAGIIKFNVPTIVGETHPETEEIFINVANEKRSLIKFADTIFEAKRASERVHVQTFKVLKNKKIYFDALSIDLKGNYQQKNVQTILAATEKLINMGFGIQDQHIEKGLKNVQQQTGLMGRWQTLQQNPHTICDTGHNEAGIKMVIEQLESMKPKNLHIVFGMVNDKPAQTILKLLPKNAQYYFCQAQTPRALDSQILANEAKNIHQLIGEAYKTVEDALKAAQKNYQHGDIIFVGGSTFVVAEVI